MPEPTYELLSVEYSPTKTAGNRGPYLYKVKCSCGNEHSRRSTKSDLSDTEITEHFHQIFHPRAGRNVPRKLGDAASQ